MLTDKERLQELIQQEIRRRKKRNRKVGGIVLAIICAIVLVFAAIIPGIKSAIFIEKYGKEIYDVVGVVEEEKTIKFGRYEQDNNVKNGAEEIEWYVLKVEDGRALVLSKYVLDTHEYNNSHKMTAWYNSDIREWLNQDFLSKTFTNEEQAVISNTMPWISISGMEVKTNDKIFLLSTAEANYFHLFDEISWHDWYRQLTNPNRGPCYPTKYVKAKGITLNRGYCQWWSRNDEANDENFCFSVCNVRNPFPNATPNIGVRPALWIDLNVFSSE